MNRTNLIPQRRRLARQRRLRLRGWIVVNLGWALLLGSVGVGISLASQAITTSEGELERIGVDLDATNAQLARVKETAAHDRQLLGSAQAVSNQPDWSLLLAKISGLLGDDVVLERCEIGNARDESTNALALQPVALSGKPAAVAPSAGWRMSLRLSGAGKSQQAVAQFVLGLESMKLFDRVHLLQTSQQEFQGREAVGFEIECSLRGQMGGTL